MDYIEILGEKKCSMSLNFVLRSFCALMLYALMISPLTASNSLMEETIEISDVIITSEFISTWSVEEVRDHAVIHVLSTDDFVTAYKIVDELRKMINEPILVKHGMVNDKISYEIVVGRFDDTVKAENYLNMLR